MEVYILDSLYRRTAVVDRFESLIWTERWKDVGDFELLLPSTPVNRSIFTPDTRMVLNDSKRIMVVETIEDNTDAEQRARLKVKGRSQGKILQDRLARPNKKTTEELPKWTLTGKPHEIANAMFKTVCIDGAVDPGDIIPLVVGTTYTTVNIPFPTEVIIWEQEPATLFSAIKNLCDIFNLGFQLLRDGDTGKLYFDIYTGADRTTEQGVLPPVVFSPELDTVQNTTRLMTIEDAKNVAYVFNEQGFEVVYADGVDPTTAIGNDRRVLNVTPSKISVEDEAGNQREPTPAEVSAYLIQEGKNELTKHRSLLAFDGEINQHSPYKYGRDYNLGDLVEMRDSDGMGNNMRVTEQIFVHDGEGERSYPTLAIDSFIIPGVWNSWLGKRFWADFGVTDYWNTQP